MYLICLFDLVFTLMRDLHSFAVLLRIYFVFTEKYFVLYVL